MKHWGQKTKTVPGITSIFLESLQLPASVLGIHMPLLAVLELWMISSGRSAPSSEKNVGLMEWRGDGHCLFHLVAENWMVLFSNLIRLHFSEIQVSVFLWNILTEKGLLMCERCQIGGAWKTSLRTLGEKINMFSENWLLVPEWGLALTCSSLIGWYLAFYIYIA